jgi:hypothetical protein
MKKLLFGLLLALGISGQAMAESYPYPVVIIGNVVWCNVYTAHLSPSLPAGLDVGVTDPGNGAGVQCQLDATDPSFSAVANKLDAAKIHGSKVIITCNKTSINTGKILTVNNYNY